MLIHMRFASTLVRYLSVQPFDLKARYWIRSFGNENARPAGWPD
jgi:hypothetical protein